MNGIYSLTMAESDALSRWELRILSSVRKDVKSEKKIAKDIALNALTTSQLITGLISRGYIERTVSKGRIRRHSYTERFAITQEGLITLEEFTRRSSPWNQLTELLRQESYELPLKMTIVAVRIAYRLTKFVLKS
jgi:DNA-binding MarR family transcriptional regulator